VRPVDESARFCVQKSPEHEVCSRDRLNGTEAAFCYTQDGCLTIRSCWQFRLFQSTAASNKPSSDPLIALGLTPRPDSSVVERGPEKAGVGGSIPSLATI
jgi:hypothetical protein